MPTWTLAQTYQAQDCPVAGLYVPDLRTPDRMVRVVDQIDGLTQNDPTFRVAEVVTQTSIGIFRPSGYVMLDSVPSGALLVTDVWQSGNLGTTDLPLFWTYEPKFDVVSPNPKGAIRVTTWAGTQVDPQFYQVQVGDQLLAPSGLVPRYSDSVEWSVIPSGEAHRTRLLLPMSFVEPNRSHLMTYPAQLFGQTRIQEEFINPEPLYIEGLDWERGDFGEPGADAEIIVERNLATATLIAVQQDPNYVIRLEPPLGGPFECWHPRVHQGMLLLTHTQAVEIPVVAPSGMVYVVRDPGHSVRHPSRDRRGGDIPTLRVRQEEADRIDGRTIHVDRIPLLIETSGTLRDDLNDLPDNTGYPWYVPLQLTDAGPGRRMDDGTPSGVTLYFGDTAIPNEDIQDWDLRNGFIRLRRPLPPTTVPIYASYRYKPMSLEIRSVDLNPRVGESVWASGAIRVVLTRDDLAWHYASAYPSGSYDGDSLGYTIHEPWTQVPLLSGIILGDYQMGGFSPQDLTIVDIRRQGGALRPEFVEETTEPESFTGDVLL